MSKFTEEVTDALETAERYGNLSKEEYDILDSDDLSVDVEFINGEDKVANFFDYSTNKRFSLFVSGYKSGELYT
jgi:hypothetical protein